MVARVLANTGATVWAQGIMYKAVAQSVLLYGSDICAVTGYILKVLGGFHDWVERRITGMTTTRGVGGEW